MLMQSRTIFVFSLLLTSALIPINGDASRAAAWAAAPASATPLTPEVMGKMLILIAEKGGDHDFPAILANALGLTASGQSWAGRSIALPENGRVHGFAISRGADQDLLITLGPAVFSGTGTGYCYRARRDGTVTAAIVFDVQTQHITALAPADAQKGLNAELAIWNDVAASNK